MKFAFLSTISNPLLPGYLHTCIEEGIDDIVVILESGEMSQRDKDIFQLRTNGAFENSLKTIHNLGKNIQFYFVDTHLSERALMLYASLKIDCAFNAGTPRKLSQSMIELFPHGVVNIHPGVLPKYRGCSCVEWAILNDDKVGNTAHFMTNEYDAGPIIAIETYKFDIDTDYVAIRTLVYRKSFYLAATTLSSIERENIYPNDLYPQDEIHAQYWKPIPLDLEYKAIEKANRKKYKYQYI